MAEQDRSLRTEQPTARRLKKAREKGQVARSAELPGVVMLAGFLVFCRVFGAAWLDRLASMVARSLEHLATPDLTPERLMALFTTTAQGTGALLLAPLGMLAAATVAGNLVQGPPALSLKPLTPQWSRLAPLGNLRKVFSLRQWVEVVKIVVKLSLYTSVAFTAARDAVLATPTGASGAAGTLRMLLSMSGTVIFRVTLLAAGLAVLDYLFRRYDHTRSLKMSKKEVRDERREMEGDPLVRARIRSKQLSLARSRMMVDVAKATVVVTNPTHYAVALRYVPDEMDVPRVVAKGRERIAARIREIASGHGIPIVSDPPLARSLYKSVPIGRDVPPALFRAVAEVLALVLKPRRRGPAREHRP